jgi:ParB family chromosome partitioning protein
MADALERGHDEDDIALMFGVQRPDRTRNAVPAGCHSGSQDAVESGTVTVTQARQLASLKPEAAGKGSRNQAATAGTTGHEKARRQRQILGEAKPRLKTRKEITKALESARVSMQAHSAGCLGRRNER